MRVFLLIAAILLTSPALVNSQQTASRDVYLDKAAEYHDLMIAEMEELKSQSDIQPADLQEYLFHAFLAVYYAKVHVNMNHHDSGIILQTNNLENIVELGFLESWPLNPVNNWEPMKVLPPESGFSAGDICLALCPSDYYTSRTGGAVPMSFDLFVYGPNPEFAEYAEIAQMPDNKEWSTPPEGVLYGFSYYIAPDRKLKPEE